MGKQRISIVPVCTKSIPYTSLLDDYSMCSTREYGEIMEVVPQTDDKNTSTVTLYSTEAFSSNSATIRI